MRLIFDSEFDGLNPTVCWCLVAKDVDTGQVWEFLDEQGYWEANERESLRHLFNHADKVISHNGLAFDLYHLDRLGIIPRAASDGKEVDTLVISRLLNPDRPGGHSVEAWAKEKGWPVQKVAHEDWSRFSPEMLERCRADVEIQERIYRSLQEEAKGWDWSLSVRMEHALHDLQAQMERTGWKFDLQSAKGLTEGLDSKMKECYEKLKSLLGYWPVSKGEVKRPFKKDGTYTKMVEDWLEEVQDDMGTFVLDRLGNLLCDCVSGSFTRIEWQPIELSQTEKVARRLQQLGWEPTEYTEPTERHPHGLPKLRPNKEVCPNLLKMDNEAGVVLAEYSKYQHRYGQIKGWVENCRERGDGRVSTAIAGITNTGRRKHAIVANVPKAEESVFLGPEMRSLFVCEPGHLIVGFDAKQLELRMLAHYMNDSEFTSELLGGDIHTALWEAAKEYVPSRSVNKNCTYALIYGASDTKIGLTAEHSKRDAKKVGEAIRARWMGRFPALENLIKTCQTRSKRGYLIGLDGRKIWMRRDDKGNVQTHKALNTLLQGAGGAVMNYAYLYTGKMAPRYNAKVICYMHDEVQSEVVEDKARLFSEEVPNCAIKGAERFFKIRCKLEVDTKVGERWAEVH